MKNSSDLHLQKLEDNHPDQAKPQGNHNLNTIKIRVSGSGFRVKGDPGDVKVRRAKAILHHRLENQKPQLSCGSVGSWMAVVLGAGGFWPCSCKCRCRLFWNAIVSREVKVVVCTKLTESMLNVCIIGRPGLVKLERGATFRRLQVHLQNVVHPTPNSSYQSPECTFTLHVLALHFTLSLFDQIVANSVKQGRAVSLQVSIAFTLG